MNDVMLCLSQRGKPTEKSSVEAFKGKVRSEYVGPNQSLSLTNTKQECEAYRHEYNTRCRHSSIGNKPPT